MGAIMKNKILFLDVDVDDFGNFLRQQRNLIEGVESKKMYKNMPSFIKKVLLFLGINVNKCFLYLIYGEWKKHLNDFDYFIIPSRKSCKYAIELLRNKNVFVYYWNLVTDKEIDPNIIKNCGVKLCTFDEGDAKKFGIRYVDTYFFNLPKIDCKITNDIFYVGVERDNRKEKVDSLKKSLSNYAMNYDITISNNTNDKSYMSYQEIIERIQCSKSILDLTRNNQVGLTLRPLEALQFKKKLITDNKNIVNYPFYNKQNIFILGEDDMSSLYDFINSPYVDINRNIREYYYFENWLQRVLQDE